MIAELVEEYVEERVRQFPTQAFDVGAVRQALRESLKEGEAGFDLGPRDDTALAQLLDRHPFLVRASGASALSWKPGLDKSGMKQAGAKR